MAGKMKQLPRSSSVVLQCFSGIEEVNGLINRGGKVTSIEPGRYDDPQPIDGHSSFSVGGKRVRSWRGTKTDLFPKKETKSW